MADIQFTTHDGRRLGVSAHGDAGAPRVIVFCHPAPGSSVFDPDPSLTDHRVRMVAVDRPGYGSSDPWPEDVWPSVAGAADELAEYLRSDEVVAETLGIDDFHRFGVVGWSEGGRVALALAARHPDLVDRLAVVATPAPNEEVPWIPDDQLEALGALADEDPAGAVGKLGVLLSSGGLGHVPEDPEEELPLDPLGIGQADAAALSAPGLVERLQLMLRDAYRQGADAVAADILAHTIRPWGFDLSDIEAETLLVYGDADPTAGVPHGVWYRDHLAHARLQQVPGAGHLAIHPAWGDILGFLA